MLSSIFRPKPKVEAGFVAKPFGPGYELLNDGKVRVREGRFAGQTFELSLQESEHEMHVRLKADTGEVGHCDLEFNTHEANVVLWYLGVQEEYRQCGLASLIARVALRRALMQRKKATFAIRMLRLIKPNERVTRIQNVGIAVIARKLGFSSEYSLEELLRQQNVELIELIESDAATPPGYRIVLKSLPYVLIAFLVDPATGHPLPTGHPAYSSLVTPEAGEQWVRERRIIIGNGNAVLRRDGVSEMVARLADNSFEAHDFRQRIRPLPD